MADNCLVRMEKKDNEIFYKKLLRKSYIRDKLLFVAKTTRTSNS